MVNKILKMVNKDIKRFNMVKKKIYIDFDGVLNNYKGWGNGDMNEPREGAFEFIQELALSYKILIFTTRNRESVWKWLIRYHFDSYIKDVTNIKEPAFV